MPSKDIISVILCTRDISNVRKVVWNNLMEQTIDFEVIISEGTENNNIVRNKGFAKSTGNLIFFMDEDVILQKNCLKELHKKLRLTKKDFCYCSYSRCGAITGIQKGREFNYSILKKVNYINTMTLMERKIFPGFDPEIKRLQDWDLFLTICENGYKGVFVDEVLFNAIYSVNSISARGPEDWKRSEYIVKKKHNLLEE